MRRIILSFLILAILNIIPIAAKETDRTVPNSIAIEANVSHSIGTPNDIVENLNPNVRGNKVPTTNWDIGANDYTVQFVMDSAIYTNVLFSNHSGDIYLDITTTSTNDTALICELYREGTDRESGDMPATAATIDTNGNWNVHFYNLGLETSYYVRFVKIHDGVDVTGIGTFSVNE